MFLNVSIHKKAKIQSRCRWLNFLMLIQTSERAIAQFHKSQWNLQWKNYKKCIANINASFAQRFHLFKKSVRIRDNFQKIKSILATYIRIKRIKLNIYLHLRNVSSANSFWCNCKWSHQTEQVTASQVKNRKSKFSALTQVKIDGETRVHQRRRKNHQFRQ